MAIHHKTKEKYLKLKDSGLTADELKEQMLADEIDSADIEPFLTESYSDKQGEVKEKEPQAPKAPKKEKASPATETANEIYEEWKTSVTYDDNGKPVVEKVKKIKDVKLTADRVARLNEHAISRKVQYFLKQN